MLAVRFKIDDAAVAPARRVPSEVASSQHTSESPPHIHVLRPGAARQRLALSDAQRAFMQGRVEVGAIVVARFVGRSRLVFHRQRGTVSFSGRAETLRARRNG